MDFAFISDLRQGGEEGFREFYLQFNDLIRGFCAHYVRNSSDAEDLAHEVILKVREKILLYDESRPFKPWVYQVARNVCLNFLRSNKRGKGACEWAWTKSFYATTSKIHIMDGRPSPLSEVCNSEGRSSLNAGLDELSEEHKTVILLKYAENLSRSEIAEVLELPEATVKSRLYHALKLLKNNMNPG